MQDAFTNAVAPARYNVLGLTLERLTLGHAFLLARAESPLVGEGEPTVADLISATFICSQPWREAERDARKWWYKYYCWIWGRLNRKADYAKETETFLAYLEQEMSVPLVKRTLEPGQKEREAVSPWFYRLLALALSDFGLSKADALDTPLAELNCLWAALGEYRGNFDLWTDRDESLFLKQQELDKEDLQYG